MSASRLVTSRSQRVVTSGAGRASSSTQGNTVLTAAQAQRFRDAAKGDRLHPLYVLVRTTLTRQGELLGLSRQDIDLAVGTLSVGRHLVRTSQRWPRAELKTAKGRH